MRTTIFRRRWSLSLVAVPFVLAVAAFRIPTIATAPNASAPTPAVETTAAPSEDTIAIADTLPTPPPEAAPATTAAPGMETLPTPPLPPAEPTAAPTETATASLTPSVEPTPTARPPGTPLRVGLQAGHWKSKELPDELARLRTSSGAFAAGYTEAEINLDIARRVAALLESNGIVVDILPATIPPGYDADAFVTLHADGSSNTKARGFKLATPWRTSRASQHLLDALTAEYAQATGMPKDSAITSNMRGYYAFNYRRHQHAIAKTTPAVIVEMGFLTSPIDRQMLVGQPDTIAVGIANGIVRYLNERDPLDGAALLPPSFQTQRPASPDGVDLRAAPREDARTIYHAAGDRRLFVIQERDGWYQVIVRGNSQIMGWVRKDEVTVTADPTPTPPPITDS